MYLQKTKYIEYITCLDVDMNFIFECSTWEDKIHIHKGVCNILFLKYKHTDNDVFDDFPKISDHLMNICKDSKIVLLARQRFPNIFRRLPKVTDVSIIQYIWALFSNYVAIAMAILRLVTKTCYFHVWRCQSHVIFRCENITFMRQKAHLVFDWFLYNKPVYCPLTKLGHVSCVGV